MMVRAALTVLGHNANSDGVPGTIKRGPEEVQAFHSQEQEEIVW